MANNNDEPIPVIFTEFFFIKYCRNFQIADLFQIIFFIFPQYGHFYSGYCPDFFYILPNTPDKRRLSIDKRSKYTPQPSAVGYIYFGGNMWESNPPRRFLANITGFEDRGAHQHPSTPMGADIIAWGL